MNKHQPTKSALDLYIDEIVRKLIKKFDRADKNRYSKGVRFIFNKYTYGQWMMRGAKKSECFEKETIYIEYTELIEAMENNTLPKQIKDLL